MHTNRNVTQRIKLGYFEWMNGVDPFILNRNDRSINGALLKRTEIKQ